MFTRLIAWIKGVWNKMIGKETLKTALNVDSIVSSDMATAIQLWCNMYENKATWLNADVKSLNLPASIAADIARMVTIEMKVQIEGSLRGEYLNTEFDKAVMGKIRTAVEFGAAKGGLVFKPYIENNGTITVDFVQADMFYPVRFDGNGDLMAAVFVDQKQLGDRYYTRLEYHDFDNGKCTIRNLAFKSSNKQTLGSQVSLENVPGWELYEPEITIANLEKPLFSYFKYPLANNIDPTSSIGVSCYSRAVNLIQNADEIWSNLVWEFESGKRALYVDILAFGKDDDGKQKLPKNRLYRTLDTGGAEDSFYKEWSPDFREASILSGLDAVLKKIEFECGLAYGTISDPSVEVKTATEIKTSKQRTYTTVTDTQKALQDALEHLVYAMDVYATLYKLSPSGSWTITFDFDDSVVTDKDLQMTQDRSTVNMGAMPKWQFLVRNYRLDEKTAKEWIAETQAEQASVADLFPDQE